jgi:hypothetical protein
MSFSYIERSFVGSGLIRILRSLSHKDVGFKPCSRCTKSME